MKLCSMRPAQLSSMFADRTGIRMVRRGAAGERCDAVKQRGLSFGDAGPAGLVAPAHCRAAAAADTGKAGDNEAAAAGASPTAARRYTRAEQARITGTNHGALPKVAM